MYDKAPFGRNSFGVKMKWWRAQEIVKNLQGTTGLLKGGYAIIYNVIVCITDEKQIDKKVIFGGLYQVCVKGQGRA